MRNVAIIMLVAALSFTLWRLGDVERQRYAALVGLCPGTITAVEPICLSTAEPRESALWNIYYGLMP
ncbi:MAG: hypothetical protein EON59_06715 [Alphaproteobacteria bacterium]|nr:MAG: hypothetical protein EON59_06715 [Alphaproteobacteria bacterium]